MSDSQALPWRFYRGLTGHPAVVVLSVRTDPETNQYKSRWEFVEGITEDKVAIACRLRVDDLEKDESVVRIVISAVSSELRRESGEVFGKVILPFKRVNGKHP